MNVQDAVKVLEWKGWKVWKHSPNSYVWHCQPPDAHNHYSWIEEQVISEATTLLVNDKQVMERVDNHLIKVVGETTFDEYMKDEWSPAFRIGEALLEYGMTLSDMGVE